jgi:protease I
MQNSFSREERCWIRLAASLWRARERSSARERFAAKRIVNMMEVVMELTGKRAAILVEQQYQEMEVWYPCYRLREAGCKVTFVGPEAGQTYPSKLGYPAKSDKAAKDVSANEFDIIVIPGGFAPDFIRRSEAMIRLVSDMAEQGKIVAAICHGPWVLCSTQALKGKKATCFFAIKDDVINAGAKYSDAEVVRDGNLITSRKPDDLPAFMQNIIQAAKELKPAMAGMR